MMSRFVHTQYASVLTMLAWSVLISACGSGSGDNISGSNENAGGSDLEPPSIGDISLPAGNVMSFGAITVADDGGEVSDIIASFY